MTLDVSPAPRAASRGRRIAAHAAVEAELIVRNGEQVLLALVIPVAALVAGMLIGNRFGVQAETWPAAVIGLAWWSTMFTTPAIGTAFERRYGVLERLAATPLTRFDLLAGKVSALSAIALGQVALLAGLATILGWRPSLTPVTVAAALLGAAMAAVSFTSLALILASLLRAEATLAVANLVYLVGAATGLLIPASAWPGPWDRILEGLPTGALGVVLRDACSAHLNPTALLVLAGWAAVAALIARRVFRWTA